MDRVSPTLEGFRAAFRRPALALGEITWRWVIGATAITLLFFGLVEYMSTLPVTNGELLFLRTRQPYLVAEAIMHILRGSLDRAVMSVVLAALFLVLLWMIAASVGRIATVGATLDYIRDRIARKALDAGLTQHLATDAGAKHTASSPISALLRLNFLRVSLTVAAIVGLIGAVILAGLASPDSNPHPGVTFLLFLPLAAAIWLAWSALNWLLSLAAIFAVRDRDDAVGAISAAVNLCRERTSAVLAVSAWTGLAHVVAFVGGSMIASVVLGVGGLLPWRLVILGLLGLTLAYFAVADWLYTARLAGYVCIAETPEALLAPQPPPITVTPPSGATIRPTTPVQTTIDRDEPILSDVPNLITEF